MHCRGNQNTLSVFIWTLEDDMADKISLTLVQQIVFSLIRLYLKGGVIHHFINLIRKHTCRIAYANRINNTLIGFNGIPCIRFLYIFYFRVQLYLNTVFYRNLCQCQCQLPWTDDSDIW